jgi:hypothetical protein
MARHGKQPAAETTPETAVAPSTSAGMAPTTSEVAQTAADIVAARERIAQLQELKELHDQTRALQDAVSTGTGSRRHRDDRDSSSDSDRPRRSHEVTVKNIPIFTPRTSFQKRAEWLIDVQRAFEGAPRKFRKDRRKILWAQDYMDSECRTRWHRFLDEKSEEEKQDLKNSWDDFKDWTMVLIRNAGDFKTQAATSLNTAAQRETQDPNDFHSYLDSLESQFPRLEEPERALFFFAKLRPELQASIQKSNYKLPDTRLDMVSLATQHWHLLGKDNRKRPAPGPLRREELPKVPRTYANDSPRGRGRGGQGGRGTDRGTRRGRGGRRPPEYHGQKNAKDAQGKVMTCYGCGSDSHMIAECPSKSEARVGEVQGKASDSQPKNK